MSKVNLDKILYGEPRPKRLSAKQNALMRALCDPAVASVAQAGRVAGYRGAGSATAAVSSPSMQSALAKFLDTLESCGITNEKLAQKISEGLEAKETKIVSYEGQITDSEDLIDFVTRHKYLETALKLKRLLNTDDQSLEEKQPVQVLIVNYNEPEKK